MDLSRLPPSGTRGGIVLPSLTERPALGDQGGLPPLSREAVRSENITGAPVEGLRQRRAAVVTATAAAGIAAAQMSTPREMGLSEVSSVKRPTPTPSITPSLRSSSSSSSLRSSTALPATSPVETTPLPTIVARAELRSEGSFVSFSAFKRR